MNGHSSSGSRMDGSSSGGGERSRWNFDRSLPSEHHQQQQQQPKQAPPIACLQNTTNQLLGELKKNQVSLIKAVEGMRKEARDHDKKRSIEFAIAQVSLVSKDFRFKQFTPLDADGNPTAITAPATSTATTEESGTKEEDTKEDTKDTKEENPTIPARPPTKYKITTPNTKELFLDIFLSFRAGTGTCLEPYFLDVEGLFPGNNEHISEQAIQPEWQQEFQTKIHHYLHRLLGKRPKLGRFDGEIRVYYE